MDQDSLLKPDKKADMIRWRVSNTEIIIDRVEEGTREGEYLFSPGTVARLEEFYVKSKDYPYKLNTLISRDYIISKLDFRVRYDTDVDNVRKIIKKINRASRVQRYRGSKVQGSAFKGSEVQGLGLRPLGIPTSLFRRRF